MGGKSSSSSSSSTTTTDARVAADGEGIAVGQGAEFTINNSFDENVAELGSQLIELASAGSSKALDAVNSSSSAALEALSRLNDSEATTTIKDLLTIGGLVTVAAIFVFRMK